MTTPTVFRYWRRCAQCHRHLELLGGPTDKEPDAAYRIPHHTVGKVDGRAPAFGELGAVRPVDCPGSGAEVQL